MDAQTQTQTLPTHYLSMYGSTILVDLCRFLSFLILVGRTPSTGGQPVARPPPTHRIKAHRHPCLELDSNLGSQCSSGRRQFMPQPRGHCDRHHTSYEDRKFRRGNVTPISEGRVSSVLLCNGEVPRCGGHQ
jgi:hypothetical protein